MVLSGAVEPGDKATVDLVEGELHFEVDRGAASFPEEPAVERAGSEAEIREPARSR